MKWVLRILFALVAVLLLAIAGLWLWSLRPEHGHVVAQIEIDRPAGQVFRWLTDDDRVKKWIGGLEEVREIAGSPNGGEVGRKFQVTEVYNNQRVVMEMTVTKYEQDRALSILVSSTGDANNGFSETGDYTLSRQNGKTNLKFDVKTTYSGYLRLFEPLITPQARKKLDEDFRRLKSLAEAEPTAVVEPATYDHAN